MFRDDITSSYKMISIRLLLRDDIVFSNPDFGDIADSSCFFSVCVGACGMRFV